MPKARGGFADVQPPRVASLVLAAWEMQVPAGFCSIVVKSPPSLWSMEMGIAKDADVAWEVFNSNIWGAQWGALPHGALLALQTPPVAVVKKKGTGKMSWGGLGKLLRGCWGVL